MKNFILIGAAGYIAPRHMRAIKDTGNNLLAALDKSDSVGVIDSYFPDADFFTEFERFDRHVSKLIREGYPVDYVSVCSPNYLHDSHIRFGLRIGADVICEKPLVLNPWNLNGLRDIEQETGRRVYTILQLRHHPGLQELKQMAEQSPPGKVYDIGLAYITPRGKWYYSSWKGEEEKSGGITANIGIHFFDMLNWAFGDVRQNIVHVLKHDRAAGYLEFEKARVRWFLSINAATLPATAKLNGACAYRSITIDGREIEFSNGFTDLHTQSYQAIARGRGFGLEDAATALQIIYDIRKAKPQSLDERSHPLAGLPLSAHPFQREELAESPVYF